MGENCTFDSLNWDEIEACLPLPLSIVLLLFFTAGWTVLLIISFFRYLKHACSATKGMVVGKKLQILQIWFYSFFFTLVYLTGLFSLFSLAMDKQKVAAIVLAALIVLTFLICSRVDVVGNHNRKPGINAINFRITLEYILTLHLPKAVWKIAAHNEFRGGENFDEEGGTANVNYYETEPQKSGKLTKFFGLDDLTSHVSPRVYDVKDIVAIQGCFLGLPSLALFLFTMLRTNDTTLYGLNIISFVFLTISSLSTPLLGDYERTKSLVAIPLLFVKRILELTARLGFYVAFISITKFVGLLMLLAEFLFMFATHFNQSESPLGGRIRGPFHRIYASTASIIFGMFRRVKVDKDLVDFPNEMSPTIELIRYVEKFAATAIGYLCFIGKSLPDWSSAPGSEKNDELKNLLLISGAAGVLVVICEIFEFLCIYKSQLSKAEVKKVLRDWGQTLCKPFRPQVVYVNRDRNMGDPGILF